MTVQIYYVLGSYWAANEAFFVMLANYFHNKCEKDVRNWHF